MARSTRAYAFALEHITLPEAPQILEIGAGQGFGAAHLSRAFPQGQVYSIDITMECLKPDVLETGPHPPEFILGSATDIPLETNSMDAVFVVMTFHCLPQPQTVMNEIARVLKPGGQLVLVDVDGRHWMKGPFELTEHLFISKITHAYKIEELTVLTVRAGLVDFQVQRRPGKERGFMMWVFARKPKASSAAKSQKPKIYRSRHQTSLHAQTQK